MFEVPVPVAYFFNRKRIEGVLDEQRNYEDETKKKRD